MDNFERIQTEVAIWTSRKFPNAQKWYPLQDVRLEADLLENRDTEKIPNAIGNIVIYLMHFCHLEGLSFSACVNDAWDEVKERDWNKHREEHNEPR